MNHMTENNLFSNSQHGFIKGKSCVTQLLDFMEEITQAIDNGDELDIIYLDFNCQKGSFMSKQMPNVIRYRLSLITKKERKKERIMRFI